MESRKISLLLGILISQWISSCFAFLHPSVDLRTQYHHKSSQARATSSRVGSLGATSDILEADALICGGGPAGLLSAIMLAQKYPERKVKVYERILDPPPSPVDDTVWGNLSKFYLIGLGGRGQTSLAKFGVWDAVENVCTAVVGRKDWTPQSEEPVEDIFTDRKFTTQVLPRDKLVSVLYKYIVDNYSEQVELHYGYEVRPIDFGEAECSESVVVEILESKSNLESNQSSDTLPIQRVSAKLLIAADGTGRTFANEMEAYDEKLRESMNPLQRLVAGPPFQVKRYEDDNQRIYKTIPVQLPAGWRPDLNYSVRTKDDRIIFDVLPANKNSGYCATLLLRKDDELAQEKVDPQLLRSEFDRFLPMFSELLDDDVIAEVARKPPSFLPAFRYVTPRLNQGDHTVVLGDCIHTVKPYFGLGANSALEDVKILSDCLDTTNSIPDAVHEFTRRRAKDSQVLVRLSRELDRPGVLGIFTFLVPIIMDAIFSKLSPQIFSPNTIRMLQQDDITFQEVATKKRLDRILQLSAIGVILGGFGVFSTSILNLLSQASDSL